MLAIYVLDSDWFFFSFKLIFERYAKKSVLLRKEDKQELY
jgi:hypothetical protein